MLKISVAICTHNRPEDVAECLAALIPQLDERFEVILIDSASAPEPAQKVKALAVSYPSIRFKRLEQPGLGLARSTALDMTRSPWIALLDDDAVPDADWGKVALELADKLGPEVAIVGGAVHPIVPKGAERPLGRRWLQLLSAIELKGEYDQTAQPAVVGANMWFRADALRAVGGFPHDLGRVGQSLLSGEDKVPTWRLVHGGNRIWYCDRLKVGHKIHRERLTRSWASRRALWDGISDKRIARMLGEPGSPIETAGVALKTIGLGLLYPAPSLKHEFFLRFWYNLGWLREALKPTPASVRVMSQAAYLLFAIPMSV